MHSLKLVCSLAKQNRNKMRTHLKQLNNIKEKLQDKHEAMDWARDERSEKWQESEAAQIHDDKMDAIETAIGSIEDAMDELQAAFNLEDLF